jgi:hypothetical protein
MSPDDLFEINCSFMLDCIIFMNKNWEGKIDPFASLLLLQFSLWTMAILAVIYNGEKSVAIEVFLSVHC